MESPDLAVRQRTYGLFVDLGRAPLAGEVAVACGVSESAVLASWARLQDQHALLLNPSGSRIRMANPFSAVPTPHRVHAAGRWWYANCAWDAFGICAALGVDGEIETTCPDCGEPIGTGVRNRRPTEPDLLFHCLVPAAIWWNDIAFT